MFVGRRHELRRLEEAYSSSKGELVVLYGRRRIGKSQLINEFMKGKPRAYSFEALEGENTAVQIRHFTDSLRRQCPDPVMKHVSFSRWEDVFSTMTDRLFGEPSSPRSIVFFDEFQWMAAGRNRLVSLLKYTWDTQWKNRRVMLILCGSVASFMVNKVVHSKALYGRIGEEILLKGLPPDEAALLFKGHRGPEEILKYLLVFGGVPKYLEEIRLDRSFAQNINRLCFTQGAPMLQEVGKMFFSQFRESDTYRRIAVLLKDRALVLREIGQRMGIASGGGLRQYIENLENAEIVRPIVPFGRESDSRLRRYALSDEFLCFYFHYMEPALRTIQETNSPHLFERLTSQSFDVWLGLAFERFCLKNASLLARKMGFEGEMLSASPFFGRGSPGFQIDLLFKRSDKVVTLCEIKHQGAPVTTQIIPEVERKCALLSLPRGHTLEKALISLHGPDPSLRDSGYFHHSLTLNDIFRAEK